MARKYSTDEFPIWTTETPTESSSGKAIELKYTQPVSLTSPTILFACEINARYKRAKIPPDPEPLRLSATYLLLCRRTNSSAHCWCEHKHHCLSCWESSRIENGGAIPASSQVNESYKVLPTRRWAFRSLIRLYCGSTSKIALDKVRKKYDNTGAVEIMPLESSQIYLATDKNLERWAWTEETWRARCYCKMKEDERIPYLVVAICRFLRGKLVDASTQFGELRSRLSSWAEFHLTGYESSRHIPHFSLKLQVIIISVVTSERKWLPFLKLVVLGELRALRVKWVKLTPPGYSFRSSCSCHHSIRESSFSLPLVSCWLLTALARASYNMGYKWCHEKNAVC